MYSRDNKIMRKLLGKTTADHLAESHAPASSVGAPSAPPDLLASFRPNATRPQNAVYNAGVPILCIDASLDKRHAVLGGRHILRTVSFDGEGLSIAEELDLRATITAQPATKTSAVADQLSIKDVKWHGDSTIFTACANGKVFSYDLARIGAVGSAVEFVQTREDSRQINTLDINPHRGTYLLSGSQDGTVRCFDVRTPYQSKLGFLSYRAVQAFKINADGVRHVKWSPKEGFYFACGTEAGVVFKWDIRRASGPVLRIPSAHEKACSSISWHPDGDHLMSGGWDNTLKVWDMSKSAASKQKAKWVIQTPAPVAAVSWRPPLWSASAQGKRCAQVAVSYDDSSHKRFGVSAVHIWDLARPTMPFKEIQRFDSSPTALMWHDQDILWVVGQDGLFNQCDVAFAPNVIDRQSFSTISFSSRGDVLMFLDERPERPLTKKLRTPIVHPTEVIPRSSYSSSPTTPLLGISRSDSEDDVVGAFVGPRKRVQRKRRASTRSVPGFSSTPPSVTSAADEQILTLDQALKATGIYRSQQAMATGHLPAAAQVSVYEYLSSHYLETLQRDLPHLPGGKPLVDRVASIMEHYAKAAENVSFFRLAQTWRLLSYGMQLLLKQRAEYHLKERLEKYRKPDPKKKDSLKAKLKAVVEYKEPSGAETPRRPAGQEQPPLDGKGLYVRSLLSEEIESTSNMPTPLVRPVNDNVIEAREYVPGKKLTPVLEAESFSLPPAVQHALGLSPRRRLDSEPISVISHDSEATQASTEGYDFYDLDAVSRAIDVPPPRNKEQPHPPDYPELPQTPNMRRVTRQGSDESFAQMFSLSDGSRRATGQTSPSDGTGPSGRSTIERIAEHEDERSDGEYESRARGKEIEESPERTRHPFPRSTVPHLAPNDSPEDVFMISQTTMATDTTSTSVPSRQVSDTVVVDTQVTTSARPSNHPSPTGMAGSPTDEASPDIVESDYFPWPDDPPYYNRKASDLPPPVCPYTLVTRALEFETRKSALNASAMILLLKPLLPDRLIDPNQATAILKQHHSRLMGMRLFVQAALLRNLCVKGWPEGLPQWGENYASIFSSAQQGIKVGLMCPRCRKPREMDPAAGEGAIWACERCRAPMAPCAVCGHRELPTDEPSPTLLTDLPGKVEPLLGTWWYCPGCAHGGHATCLQEWHLPANDGAAPSEGCCPVDGCGHACLPGKWANECRATRSEEVSRAAVEKTRAKAKKPSVSPSLGEKESVQGDTDVVAQSRAVASVRETLGDSATSGVGILSSSPGRGERERRKSVKFVREDPKGRGA